ncbi:MAG: beta-ketoacyl-[acyl-carrier-protein] synthase family protein [Planctomycetes bacterium]|nr:beta-ketoacyl-[acyl-carrier-protein] synthase family protein [Planctomycetota bacterium]
MTEPVVVTGFGATSALGATAGDLWRGALRGRRGVRELDLFATDSHRTRLAAQVDDAGLPARFAHLARADRFGCTATAEAVAGLPEGALRSARAGVFFGSSTGALFEGERFLKELLAEREGDLRSIVGLQNDGPGNAVAHEFAVRGPVMTFSTACTSANVALGAALDALRSGEIDVAIAGGADELCEITYAGFNSLRAIDAAPTRPFRADRAGLSMGEGSGVLLLETRSHAEARGARALAELCGAARSCDAQHVSAPDPEGIGAATAIEQALREGGLTADDVTFVNAHGTGTRLNDTAEANAIRCVLGNDVPTVSTKAYTGHTLGAAAALEMAFSACAIEEGWIPPAIGDGDIDPEIEVRIPTEKTDGAFRRVLSNSFAFGGNNVSLLVAAP